MTQVNLPPIPSISIPRITQLHEDLNCNVLPPFEGKRLIGDDFIDFVHIVHDKMPRVPFSVLSKSLQHLAGILISKETTRELAWRLAGNQHNLKKGLVVAPYSWQLFPEWAAVQVWNVERKTKVKWLGDKKDGNKILINWTELDLFVLAGLAAGKHFIRGWPEKMFYRTETTSKLGFSRYDRRLYDRYFVGGNNYPFKDVRQLVRLRFFVLLDPRVSKAGELAYDEMSCTETFRKWNRGIMKKRERESFQCPKNYDLTVVPCHRCEMGFNFCPAGCHPNTYIKKECPKCKRLANFNMPDAEWCVDCLAKNI